MKKKSIISKDSKEIILNIESKERRCAILHFGVLQDLIVERSQSRQLSGNIYRGQVTHILHNIQSAFIDINEAENGFIHISDIIENTQKFQTMFDMDFEGEIDGAAKNHSPSPHDTDIAKQLQISQAVLVQVVKEPIGTKGARLTSNISIPGRYLVLLPNTPHRGVSKKIQDRSIRDKLKHIIRNLDLPNEMGFICRTAAMHTSKEELVLEANNLFKLWQDIVEKFNKSRSPVCLYEESDLLKKAVIMAIDKNFTRIVVDHYPTFQKLRYLEQKYGHSSVAIEFYRHTIPIFEKFGIEKDIDKALKRKVWLPSGGYLFFDKTEAMYTIDVNSGRSGQSDTKIDVEEALVHINMEAAQEIARQLRLRNIGGLIICDFIDMRVKKNQRRVLDRLKNAMQEDQAKCTILGMSEFGLVEMTRQRLRESLIQTLFTTCPYCSGKGMIKNYESVSIEIERTLKKLIHTQKDNSLSLHIHPLFNQYLLQHEKHYLQKLAKKGKIYLSFQTKDTLHVNQFEFYSVKYNQYIEV